MELTLQLTQEQWARLEAAFADGSLAKYKVTRVEPFYDLEEDESEPRAAKVRRKVMVTVAFRDRADAQVACDRLTACGYLDSEITVLMSEATRSAYLSGGRKDDQQTSGAVATGTGKLAALAAYASPITISGLRICIVGPIAAAVAGGGILVGTLVDLGIPESNVQAYEEALHTGGVVISVVPHDQASAERITGHFRDLGGENLFCG